MSKVQRMEDRATTAGLLTSPMRLAILERLLAGPAIVGELVETLGAEQAVVSKQLGVLRDAGLIRCEPQGRCRSYTLAHERQTKSLIAALDAITDVRDALVPGRSRSSNQRAAGRRG